MGHPRELDHYAGHVDVHCDGAARAAPAPEERSHALQRAGSRRPGRLLLDRDDFQIRLANHRCRSKSDELVERMYSSRGYKFSAGSEPRSTDVVTLQACNEEAVFGTLNVGFDSQRELACEALYAAEVTDFRRRGAVAAEFTRLAVESEHGSKELLGALFHVAYLFAARVGRATDMFIEVNPRHVPFYKRMLNFLPAGECKICERVQAPAVLLHCEVAYMRQQVAVWGGQRGSDRRTLYPYFCSPADEAGIVRAIGELGLTSRSRDPHPPRNPQSSTFFAQSAFEAA